MAHTQWEERLVHYQYLQEVLEDRHVLEVGCGNGSGARFLAETARRVLVVDNSRQRIDRCKLAGEWRNLEYAVSEPDRLEAGNQTFDVVVIPELERFVTRGGLLPEIRRVLRTDGVALFVVRSADRDASGSGMAYADLEEYLTQTFAHVRMVGVIPFAGTILADFNPEGDLEPQLDSSLVEEDEDPVSYIALCSNRPLPSPGYTVLQVPADAAPTTFVGQGPATLESTGELEVVARLLDREMARASTLEERLEQARRQAEELSRDLLSERGRAEVERVRAQSSESVAADQRKRAEGAERRCDSLMIRIEQGAAELSTLHQKMAELQGLRQADQWHIDELVGRLRKLEQGAGGAGTGELEPRQRRELELARVRIAELERENDDLRRGTAAVEDTDRAFLEERLEEAEARLVAAEQQTATAEQQSQRAEKRAAKMDQRVAELERQTEGQLQEKAELEKELMRSESRVVEHSRRATNAESKIVQMEVRLKRSEAEAATLSKWAEELREELKEAQGKTSARPATPEPEVAALRNDIREARERIATLETRADNLLREVEQSKAQLAEKQRVLDEALRAVDANLLEEVLELRKQNSEVVDLRRQLQDTEQTLAETEEQLRDAEQAETELRRTRRELEEFRRRVRDVDAASDELEQLRMEATRHQETQRELRQLREELEATRIELTRAEEELRGTASLPEEAGWDQWEDGEEEEEEYEGYVGPEMADQAAEEEEEEGEWDPAERIRVQERQLEALLEGAALHRAEMERQSAQVAEMDALILELQTEQRALEQKLAECIGQRGQEHLVIQQLREENTRLGRELARVQGELQRCHEERARLEQARAHAAGGEPAAAALDAPGAGTSREELERETRRRQKLEEDLEQRLAELDELRREVRSRDQALDRVRSEDTEHRAELRELRRQVREIERQAGAGPSAVEGDLPAELARAIERNEELERRLAAENGLRSEEQRETKRCESRLQELQDQLQGAEQHIAGLHDELSRHKVGLATAGRRLGEAEEQRQQSNGEVLRLRAALTQCEERGRKLEERLEERKERINQLKRMLEEEQRQVEALRGPPLEAT
jgi:chromosome segregation ATPase/ubiquinone/menaquinone biosynthesis C-methylase UbiE